MLDSSHVANRNATAARRHAPNMWPCAHGGDRLQRRVGAGRAAPCDRDARRTGPARRLFAFRLRQSGRSKGRTHGAGRARHVRQPQPFHRPRPPAARPARAADQRRQHHDRHRGREPDGARPRRAVHALRTARPHRRDRRKALLRDVRHQSGGAVLRRQARHGRGRPVLLAAFPRQGPTQPAHLLQEGREGGGARRSHGAVRLRRQRGSRTAADPRPDVGPAQARDQPRHVRGDVAEAADRQRALCRGRGRCGKKHQPETQSRLSG
jgi:hypothetical protein